VREPERRDGNVGYFVRFGFTALLLVAATLVLVLVVLPQRYVLSAGFRESGLNFPPPMIPFAPRDRIRVAARPAPTAAAPESLADARPGPAEALWSRVQPLLEAERFDAAIPFFEDYLRNHPADDDVRRQLSMTLYADGRSHEAVPVVLDLLTRREDPALRLALARTLRDQGRLEDASAQYEILRLASPDDEGLALEWARAFSWAQRYGEAEQALLVALRSLPASAVLRVELARVRYYSGDLSGPASVLEGMTDAEVAEGDGIQLRADVRAALLEPAAPDAPPATLLERAVTAREDDDFVEARALFARAVIESPNDAEVWLAYANLLEYELNDFPAARDALLEAERIGGADAVLQFRLALLEAWTGRNAAALARLDALLETLHEQEVAPGDDHAPRPPTEADVHALMGDLHRWEGRRIEAGSRYRIALGLDAENERANDGLDGLRIQIGRLIADVERPGFGTLAHGLADSDDFGRLDLGGEWAGVGDEWAWSGMVGQRWLSGQEPGGGPGDLTGTFLEISPARWWRWGTIRTSVRLGAEWMRDDEVDVSVGASFQYRREAGGVLTVDYGHQPAYGLTGTLQSAIARVTQDRLLASWSQTVGDRWTLSGQADVSRLEAKAVSGAEASARIQGALSVSRTMTRSWSLGWSALALRHSSAAPSPGGVRLFWDPALVVATGPMATLAGRLSDEWGASLRASPGLALIDERTPAGFESVPQLSLDARLEYSSPRWHGAVDLFYAQARLEGYRSYGARVTLGTASWLSRAATR
jgi:tetratricopeptide (TPR) repeat protein